MQYDLSSEIEGSFDLIGQVKALVDSHYGKIITVLLIVIAILLVAHIVRPATQGFMPSQTMYQQDQDNVGVGSENTPQGLGVGILGSPGKWYLPGGAALTSEAVGYCATADTVVPDDAWEWQYKAATGTPLNQAAMAVGNSVGAAAQSVAVQEKFKGKKSDNTLSAIAQGF